MDIDSARQRVNKTHIQSTIAAERELRNWLEANDLSSVLDFDHHPWHLSISGRQVFNRENFVENWEVEVNLTSEIDITQMYATGILKKGTDDRLAGLIDEDKVKLKMNPLHFASRNSEEMRNNLGQAIEELREKLKGRSIQEIKKKLIGQWVDRKMMFSQRT